MITAYALVWFWFGQVFILDTGLTADDCAAMVRAQTSCVGVTDARPAR